MIMSYADDTTVSTSGVQVIYYSFEDFFETYNYYFRILIP